MRNSKKNSSSFSKFLPLIIISIICSLFFWRFFLKGEIPIPGDFIVGIYYPWLDYKWGFAAGVPVKNPIMADVPSFMYPMQTFAVSLLKSGVWPLWNPHILAGIPLLANFQSAPFSVTNIFYFLFTDNIAWSIQIITAHILAAFFTYILLRYWKLSIFSSIIGGIIFSFSGFNLIWSQWNGHVLTAAFFPLIIYFVLKFLEKGKIIDGLGLAISIALQIMSGYPQLVLYTTVVIGIMQFFQFTLTRPYFFKSLFIGFFCILGFGLASIQLFPSFELLSLSQWTAEPHPREWAFLPLAKTITFIAPDYFGNHVTNNYWGPQDYTSNTGFVGVASLALAFVAFGLFKSRKEVQIALVLVAVSLILSYATPISEFLWNENILGMKSSSAHRALVLLNLGVALLAGFGLEHLRLKSISKKLLLISLGLIAFTLFIFATFAKLENNPVAMRNLIFPSIILAILVVLFGILKWFSLAKKLMLPIIALVLILEIYRFGWKFTPFSPSEFIFPHTPVTSFLTEQKKPFRISNGNTMPVNFQMSYGLETIGGYETMRPLSSSQFIATLNNLDPKANPSGRYGIIDNDTSHLLDLANTKYYLTLKKDKTGVPIPTGNIPEKFDKKRFTTVFEDKTVSVLESKSALPRAFMVYDWEVEPDSEILLSKLLDKSFPFSKKVLLEESPHILRTKTGTNKVEFSSIGAQKSVLNVETSNDGLLFVSDAWYPGWESFVGNNQTKIYKANYMFRAIAVPKGSHIIEFRYAPESFDKGLKLTAVSALVSLVLFLIYLSK